MCTVSMKLRKIKYMQLSHLYPKPSACHILLAIEYLKRHNDAVHQVLIDFPQICFKQKV